jgi:hypothetical protein
LALVASGALAVEAAAGVPLPRPRPVIVPAAAPLPPSRMPAAAPASVVDRGDATANPEAEESDTAAPPEQAEASKDAPSACVVALRAVAIIRALPAIEGQGACGIDDPVLLSAVILPDARAVAINPPATLRCEMAAAVAQWVREDMAPLVRRLGAPLRAIENFDSYQCRGRNRVFGARISEHGRGNALDIKGVRLDDGGIAFLTDPHVDRQVRTGLRHSACLRFSTVLGPGSDGYHENHVHLDLAERRSDYRICQWEVREPLDRVAPSPHITVSRAPSPHEAMTTAEPPVARDPPPPLPRRRAAGRH